jgi:predicted TIM-barrel fold metal-dependent hydrolase
MDLSATMDAVAALGERARGVALLSADVTDERLDALHAAGLRGVRLSNAYGPGTAIDEASLRTWADRVGPRGWHIAMWPQEIEEFELLLDLADRLPIPLVIDHLANHAWRPALGIVQPGFRLVMDLLATGNVWIKLSAPNRASTAGSPWPDLVPFAAALIEADPTRLLWASDWPQVGVWSDAAMPRSGELLDWLRVIGCDEALLRTILVANPETLYGFAPSSATGH